MYMPLKGLILDFDSTLSAPIWIERLQKWAVADNKQVFASMSADEVVANFGGQERVGELDSLLRDAKAASVELFIVSIGYKAAYSPHLQAAGLLGLFDPANLYGQDSPELRAVGFVKGALIQQLMQARGWNHADVLFVDDSLDHIEKARATCRTLHVAGRGGMGATEFPQIRASFSSDAAGKAPRRSPRSRDETRE